MRGTNLAQRIVTAALLAPLVVLGVLLLPNRYFALAFGVVVLVSAWEWAALVGWSHWARRTTYVLGTGLLLYGVFQWDAFATHGWLLLSIAALVWWCVALGWVVRFEQGMAIEPLDSAGVRALAGWLILLPPWGALVAIHQHAEAGPILVILLMVLIWGADSGAYFAGKRFGKRRLSPRTSPGKSWEGVFGGLLTAGLMAIGIGFFARLSLAQGIVLVALSLGSILLSVLGDVTESLFKRRVGVKDSGQLLPGHGGMLDRIDSLTAAAPFFALAVYTADLSYF
uniref:Phosphatidate cytidylyltransferase n=1 Tax=Candidatus Kentrum sp. FM TaxID=2126340 RepID=A0A450WXM6_9GAMM|nr:MAG: phosphatidate cytidylyltransferase [Candidatus Kentron sp. FM]VFJ74488.1 MAG: phosphatidate cytidylyltransferase [Candidatus Kentron sp. FM]VFK21794.1 MAG: phosphatidate cytidylyltransferase [Candidatus Kentron sp. FM]